MSQRQVPFHKVRAFVTREVRLLTGIGLFSGLVWGFFNIADEALEGEMDKFDTAILMLFRNPDNVDQLIGPPWVHEMVRDITALGSFAVLGIFVICVSSCLVLARMRDAAMVILVAVLGGTIFSTLLKMAYNRPRPDLTTISQQFTASFPSGHAMLSAVTYLTIGALLARIAPTRAMQWLSVSMAIFLTVLVGLSRVYMGVHYPSDVLAGWSIGAAWAVLCSMGAVLIQRRRDWMSKR